MQNRFRSLNWLAAKLNGPRLRLVSGSADSCVVNEVANMTIKVATAERGGFIWAYPNKTSFDCVTTRIANRTSNTKSGHSDWFGSSTKADARRSRVERIPVMKFSEYPANKHHTINLAASCKVEGRIFKKLAI